MNAVISYDDFIRYMGYRRENNVIIPIILIKPSVLIMIRDELQIGSIFEYFHCRTGDGLTFFLPGYAHYPGFEYRVFLSPSRPADNDALAFEFCSRGRVRFYYSQNDFTDFVKRIEDSNQGFRYYGDTELLFAKYDNERFELDAIKEYNLTELFLSGGSERLGLRSVEIFLEDVLRAHNCYRDEDTFFQNIDDYYTRHFIRGRNN